MQQVITACILAGMLMASCATAPREESPAQEGCNGHITTGGTAGLGYHSEDGFLSKFTIEIGMHSRPQNPCLQSNDRPGTTLSVKQGS